MRSIMLLAGSEDDHQAPMTNAMVGMCFRLSAAMWTGKLPKNVTPGPSNFQEGFNAYACPRHQVAVTPCSLSTSLT